MVDLNGYAVTARINAGATDRSDVSLLPRILSLAPASAAKGTSFLLTIEGSNLQDATGLTFESANSGHGMHHTGQGEGDPNIRVANVDVTSDGARMTAMVEILASAATGTRVIRLQTDRGQIMGPMSDSIFTVTE